MSHPRAVIETPDEYGFAGEAAAMLPDVAPLPGVSAQIAAGMAMRDRLMELRRTDMQSGAYA